MNMRLNVFHEGDLYEILCTGTLIKSITHYTGETQRSSVVEWDHLSEDVKHAIIKEFLKQHKENEA